MTIAVETLALEFSKGLRSYLTGAQMAEVVRLNDAEKSTGICHSHDYCDANIFLYEVFMKYGMNPVEDGGLELWGALWDQAWNAAKASGFKIN